MAATRAFPLRRFADWIDAIAALPIAGPLPARTVLVPGEPVAHALRRALIRANRAELLRGTRFVGPVNAATEVLAAGGRFVTLGEEDLRVARVRALLATNLDLEYFELDKVRRGPGWAEAFAQTIAELEQAGITPDDLEVSSDEIDARRSRSVARLWRALDRSAGRSWTRARLLREAAARLAAQPALWPYDGPTLIAVSGDDPAALAAFAAAVPGAHLAVHASRPARGPYMQRLRSLYGEAAERAAGVGSPAPDQPCELRVLATYLFADPKILTAPDRARSAGPDGSVTLEEHAGVDAELDAAADWVADLLDRGYACDEIAILVPQMDPLAGLLADRLARVIGGAGAPLAQDALADERRDDAAAGGRDDDGTGAPPTHATPRVPVFVAGGLPLYRSGGGARILELVRALRAHLPIDAFAAVLRGLRATGDGGRALSQAACVRVATSLGTVGGSSVYPEGATEWARRLREREEALADPAASRTRRHKEAVESDARLLADLRAVRPAVEALCEVAQAVGAGAPLRDLWPRLHDFLAAHVRLPVVGGAPAHQILDGRLRPLAEDAAAGARGGDDALTAIEEQVLAARVGGGRFGDPAIYVGTIGGAAALPFRAVRIIGLCEGSIPRAPHEDSVLPAPLRERLAPALPDASLQALADLHAVDRVVANTSATLALSTSRRSIDGTDREPSFLFLEAAAALGRGGRDAPPVPDRRALHATAFAPARAAATARRQERPLTTTAWLALAANRARPAPTSWAAHAVLDPANIAGHPSPPIIDLSGLLGLVVPGDDHDHALSATGLEKLLVCPYRFALEKILGYREPDEAVARSELDPMTYGHLVHEVHERLFAAHGERITAHDGDLTEWRRLALALADECLREYARRYPLESEGVRAQQATRLHRDVRALIESEWKTSGRRFVAVERDFGYREPVAPPAGEREIFVHGFIDRLDIEGDRILIRDLKTGGPKPRTGVQRDAHHRADAQIGLYALAALARARDWGLPPRVAAAYVYVGARGQGARAFIDDADALLAAARGWIEIAASLLGARVFPRTPDADDCKYCPFVPVCGDDAQTGARRALAGTDGPLGRFRALKEAEG